MHSRLLELEQYLDRQQANIEQAVATVDQSRRHERPGTDRWSVNEVVGHLAIIEERIARLLSGAIAKARAEGLGPDPVSQSFLSTWSDTRILDRSTKIRNPKGDPPEDMADPFAAFDSAR